MDADKYAEENGGELDEEYGKSIFFGVKFHHIMFV